MLFLFLNKVGPKNMKKGVHSFLAAGIFAAWFFVVAQPPALRGQAMLSPSEFASLVQTIETTSPLPASAAPAIGNFYTITYGESWPPLPVTP